jgi:hypothetical protein
MFLYYTKNRLIIGYLNKKGNRSMNNAITTPVIWSDSGLMWRDDIASPKVKKNDVVQIQTVPDSSDEVFFRNQEITGTLIPKEVLHRSNKQKLSTGNSFSCASADNDGIAVGKHIFGSIDRIQKIFVITKGSRLIVMTEFGVMYTVFVDGVARESFEPTTLHTESPRSQNIVSPRTLSENLFYNNSLQVVRLTGEVWNSPDIGRSGKFKTVSPYKVTAGCHNGVAVGYQAPGVKINGFVASVHQVTYESAIAVTQSGAIYFIVVVG